MAGRLWSVRHVGRWWPEIGPPRQGASSRAPRPKRSLRVADQFEPAGFWSERSAFESALASVPQAPAAMSMKSVPKATTRPIRRATFAQPGADSRRDTAIISSNTKSKAHAAGRCERVVRRPSGTGPAGLRIDCPRGGRARATTRRPSRVTQRARWARSVTPPGSSLDRQHRPPHPLGAVSPADRAAANSSC